MRLDSCEPGELGNAISRPTPAKGRRVYEFVLQVPQLAHGSQTCTLSLFYLESSMDTPSTRWSSPFLRTINPKMALLVNLPTVSL